MMSTAYLSPLAQEQTPELHKDDVTCQAMDVRHEADLDARMPSLVSGTTCQSGESTPSIRTLQEKLSMRTMRSMGKFAASESQESAGSTSSGGDCNGPRELPHEPSFEVDQVGDIRAVDSGWLDDDVEEVMVVKKKRKPLSVIIEATEGVHPSSPRASERKDSATLNASDFEYIRTLQASETGEVLIARKADTEHVYTVKLIRKSGWNGSVLAARIRSQQKLLRVLTECRVPFVTRLFWSFEDERAMYLVVDRTDGRALCDKIQKQGPLFAHEAVLCAAELAEGISGLHAHGIVHTGLNPEDILIDDEGHLFISGFDDATFLYDDAERHLIHLQQTSAGLQEYRAPELMLGWEYDYAVDWWSFGLLLWWMLTGTHPFVDERDDGHSSIVESKVLHSRLTEDRLGMSEDAYQLIARCLQRNTALRIDGLGVKMHSYFSAMNWEQVAAKQIEAPFARHEHPVVEDACFMEDDALSDPLANNGAHGYGDSFAFDHESVPAAVDSPGSLEVSGVRGHLEALRVDHGPSDETLKPQDVVKSPSIIDDILGSGRLAQEQSGSGAGEFGSLPDGVSGAGATRIGNLRRHSSLHFDLASLGSANSAPGVVNGSVRELGSPSPVHLRHARSILGLSLGNTDDSLGSHSWTSKLRRRTRPESPSLSAPLPPLPKGVEQIGNGIGYTRRAEARRSVMTLASLTPRTCQSFFSGRLPRLVGKRKPKEDSGVGDNAEAGDVIDIGLHEEDPMDEVMREIYGSDWAAGSPDAGPSVRVCGRGGRGRVGLGWDEAVSRDGYGAVDASFAGADSTLRLVAPGTPLLGESV
ncbi:kinase-like protein [Trametes sanguinea]|nr:kinase-like protein [Trametes sanguinea]